MLCAFWSSLLVLFHPYDAMQGVEANLSYYGYIQSPMRIVKIIAAVACYKNAVVGL